MTNPSGDLISRQAAISKIKELFSLGDCYCDEHSIIGTLNSMLPVDPQKSSRDMEEIEEIINCDADAETKCKMISNILTAKPHYFEKRESKIGHWISHYDEDAKVGWYECDHCHTERAFNTKFCPDCGYRIVGYRKGAIRNVK